MALKWGICGSGKISQLFVEALQYSPTDVHKVVAVAARSEENARQFADKNNIGKAYGGYENLAKDADVDVVYIGIINSGHLSACELMLNNGKHILCEKPMGLTKSQVQRITDLAKEKKLFCVEAIEGRFSPAYSEIRKLIALGKIGEVKLVMANFGVPVMNLERFYKKELGGGAILDLGVYPIQFALMAYGGKAPISVSAKGFLTETGVDDTSTIQLQFEGNGLASLACSATTKLTTEAYIFGTKGHIKVNVMSRPTQLEVTTHLRLESATHSTAGESTAEVLDFPVPKDDPDMRQRFFRYEADAVKECIKAGNLESPLMTHSDSLVIASIMDKARHDLGYQLDCERANMVMTCQ